MSAWVTMTGRRRCSTHARQQGLRSQCPSAYKDTNREYFSTQWSCQRDLHGPRALQHPRHRIDRPRLNKKQKKWENKQRNEKEKEKENNRRLGSKRVVSKQITK
jgi:hypothetical protein